MKRFLFVFAVMYTSCLGLPSLADVLAVSADGSTVASGVGRVLYLHDPDTVKVKQRIRVDQPVKAIAVSKDGSLAYVAHGIFGLKLDIIDTKSGKRLSRIDRIAEVHGSTTPTCALAPSPASDRLAVQTSKQLLILDMSSGKQIQKLDKPSGSVYSMALSPDAKTLVLLSKGKNNKEPKKNIYPKYNDTLERIEEIERNDGKGSTMTVIDLPTGKTRATHELFYNPERHSRGVVAFTKADQLTVLTYNNINAHLSLKGGVQLFRLKGLGYGSGIEPNGKRLLNGSFIRKGYVYDADGKQKAEIQAAPPNPGSGEYYSAFAFTSDGVIYGVTNAQRVFKLDKGYKMTAVEPIY